MIGARYFSARDWAAAGLAGGIAFAVYFYTLAPTVTLEASGQLVVAADHLGVGRVPGYPVWTLLAKGFICLFPLAQYHGHPNPAWAVNLLSAVLGALACGLLALITSRMARTAVASQAGSIAGTLAGLLFAFSPVMWSQAVIAETHALTNFYFLLLLALSLRWMGTGDERAPYLLAFLAGLGLAVSEMLIVFLPVLLLAAAFVSARDFIRFTAAGLLFCGFIFAEFTWGRPAVSHAAAIAAITLTGIALLAIWRRTRPVAFLLLLLLAGLLPYVYLPLAAAHNPPMNWGQACTWEGFWHVISRGQYEALRPLHPLAEPGIFIRDLAWYGRLAAQQFTAPLAALAVVPVLALRRLNHHALGSMLLVLAAFLIFSAGIVIGANPQPDIQNTWVGRVLFLPSFALLALLAGIGLALLVEFFVQRVFRPLASAPPSA